MMTMLIPFAQIKSPKLGPTWPPCPTSCTIKPRRYVCSTLPWRSFPTYGETLFLNFRWFKFTYRRESEAGFQHDVSRQPLPITHLEARLRIKDDKIRVCPLGDDSLSAY